MSTLGDEQQQQLVVYRAHSEAEETSRGDLLVHGSEAWFAEVVGLPNWGLDPRMDVNHVSNKDLLILFEDKVSHKGYFWKQCKSSSVKKRMEELYKPLFQVNSMPKDGYMCESFTRAVVVEVLTSSNMNWALLAEEKWCGKVGNGEVVPYREAGEELTYKRIMLNKLNSDVSILDSDIDQVEDEHKLASERVKDICNSPEALAVAKESRGIEDQMKKLKGKIAMEEIDKDHSRKMITYFTVEDPDEERAPEFASKAANNEIRLQNLQEKHIEYGSSFSSFSLKIQCTLLR